MNPDQKLELRAKSCKALIRPVFDLVCAGKPSVQTTI